MNEAAKKRREHIIQTALLLFGEKGYEATSVECIIRASGLSKGGFYHHFASKEELLEEVAQLFIFDIIKLADSYEKRTDLNALQKLNSFFREVNQMKIEKSAEVLAFLQELYADSKNIRLEWLVFHHTQQQLRPLFLHIIDQGIKEKVFHTDYPEETAEYLIRLILIHQRHIGELFSQSMKSNELSASGVIERKYSFLQKTMEDLLGLDPGLLEIASIARDTLGAFMR